MTVTINGSTGIDTGTGSLVAASSATSTYLDLYEDTDNGSNYVRLIAPTSIASNKTQTLADETGTLAPIVSGTAITLTNQTAPEFTGIPSWVKRITVMFSGVSTNGTSNYLIQLGDAGGIETTGYSSSANDRADETGSTAGFILSSGTAAAIAVSGMFIITLVSGTTFVGMGNISRSDIGVWMSAGTKALSNTLTQIRITTVNGTDTFDAGTINILYE